MITPFEDIEHILDMTPNLWDEVRHKTIFITGGTGFFGIWILDSFVHINRKLFLNANLVILTRNKCSFLQKYPHVLNYKEISFIEGDIKSFEYPKEKVDYIIHAATEASVKLNIEAPMEMFDTVVNGTRHILEMARQKKVTSFLLTSSGAVYGKQPSYITHVEETYLGAPEISANSVYGEGKRLAEVLCAVYQKHYKVPAKVARCFAFIGPHLPLDTHFAVGNFIKNLIRKEDISIDGDGTPFRSYLYASDLVIWLWTILLKGKDVYPYNVGSEHDLSIESLAKLIANQDYSGNSKVIVKGIKTDEPIKRYVPSVERARSQLNLSVSVELPEAIRKTISFYSGAI
jgi:dTDP-glucose 4,6-dehydratase